jgi:uncharacterized heparinase superfamily protein
MIGPSRFRFLSTEREIAAANDWSRSDWSKLWTYNAHYFDDLNAEDAKHRTLWHRAILSRWIRENQPTFGNGWESYPTSLRIVNWIKWALQGNDVPESFVLSLAVQARWLRTRIEFHLLGNHLWANAKALVFSGAYFEGTESTAWLSKGLSLIRAQIKEQILPDGGHFERSPMYHAIVLEDLLDLIQLSKRYPDVFTQTDVESWQRAASQMLGWMRAMTHPDGGIAFFNDAAFDVAPSYASLTDYAQTLGVSAPIAVATSIELLSKSGYARMSVGDAVMLVDIGEIGPDYLPGHAHADTLSFELSIRGQRILVNGGTSTYETNEERMRQRGTAAHNTVTVNGHDSSEVWGSFRVAKRARPIFSRIEKEADAVRLEAAHDGYHRLSPKVTHTRWWSLAASSLQIRDSLSGHPSDAVSHWHIHPAFDAEMTGERAIKVTDRGSGAVVLTMTFNEGQAEIARDQWHPRFGVEEESKAIHLSFASEQSQIEIRW